MADERAGRAGDPPRRAEPRRVGHVQPRRALGERGVWVDHVTYIDPVPAGGVIPGLGDLVDGPMRVTENVIFADNYWRSDNNVATGFDGQPRRRCAQREPEQHRAGRTAHDPHVGAGLYYISTVDPDGPLAPGAGRLVRRRQSGSRRDRLPLQPHRRRRAAGRRRRRELRRRRPARRRRRIRAAVGEHHAARTARRRHQRAARQVDPGRLPLQRRRQRQRPSRSSSTSDQNPYNGNTVSRIARRTYGATRDGRRAAQRDDRRSAAGRLLRLRADHATPTATSATRYLRDRLTITTPPASLNFVTSANGTIDIAGTSGDDRIFVTTNGTSIGATLHDFTQIVSLDGVTSVRVARRRRGRPAGARARRDDGAGAG